MAPLHTSFDYAACETCGAQCFLRVAVALELLQRSRTCTGPIAADVPPHTRRWHTRGHR